MIIEPPLFRSIIRGTIRRINLIDERRLISTIFRDHLVGDLESRSLTNVGRAVIDEYIHRTEAALCLAHQSLNFISASDMTSDRNRLPGEGKKLASRRFEVFKLSARNNDVGAGPCQPLRDSLANAAATAGDYRDLAFKGFVHLSASRLRFKRGDPLSMECGDFSPLLR